MPATKVRVTLYKAGSHDGPKVLILPSTWDEFIKTACQKLQINGIARVETLEGAHVELLDEILAGDKLRIIPSPENSSRQKIQVRSLGGGGGGGGGPTIRMVGQEEKPVVQGLKEGKAARQQGQNLKHGKNLRGRKNNIVAEAAEEVEEESSLHGAAALDHDIGDEEDGGFDEETLEMMGNLSVQSQQRLVAAISAATFQPNGFDHHDSLTEHCLQHKAFELLNMIGEEEQHPTLENAFLASSDMGALGKLIAKVGQPKKPSGEGAARFSPIIRILRDHLVLSGMKEMERRILACNLQATMPDWQTRLGVASIFDYLQEGVDVGLINVRLSGNVAFVSLWGDQHCGVVKWVKESYGFIQSPAHTEDLFYHVSEVRANRPLQTGDIVDFLVVRNPITGKLNATQISLLHEIEDEANLAALNALSAAVMRQARPDDSELDPAAAEAVSYAAMYQAGYPPARADELGGIVDFADEDSLPSVNHEPWLYKTKMCKFWPHCPRGPKCWFAHGVVDLRKPSQIPAHMLETGLGVPSQLSAHLLDPSAPLGAGDSASAGKNGYLMDSAMLHSHSLGPTQDLLGLSGTSPGSLSSLQAHNYMQSLKSTALTPESYSVAAFSLSDAQLGWAAGLDEWGQANGGSGSRFAQSVFDNEMRAQSHPGFDPEGRAAFPKKFTGMDQW